MWRITELMDDAKCFALVREARWPDGVRCPHCQATTVVKNGRDPAHPGQQHYRCRACRRYFDDLTGTILSDRRHPLARWLACLYLLVLNVSGAQIAQEIGVDGEEAHRMCTALRDTVLAWQMARPVTLCGEVEVDEVYLVAGHKGYPGIVEAEGRDGRDRKLRGERGRGTLEKERPPVLGLVERGGGLVVRLLPDVRQVTLEPVVTALVVPGTPVYTDEFVSYARLADLGYPHQTVCHAAGEYARDADGDGVCEVHVNTIEGIWALLRLWLRPHRGISQEKLPSYLAFFEAVYNCHQRGAYALQPMLHILLTEEPASVPCGG